MVEEKGVARNHKLKDHLLMPREAEIVLACLRVIKYLFTAYPSANSLFPEHSDWNEMNGDLGHLCAHIC